MAPFSTGERRVVAGVDGDGAVVDVEDVRGDVVEEALIVGDHDRAALVHGEEPLEPADGEDVEVVRGLVEQEDVRTAEEHLREQHAELEAAREGGERHAVLRHGDAETLEDGAGPGLERVAVVGGDPVLELDDARRVRGVARALGLERALLGLRAHHELVAGHGDLEDHVLVAHEAVLAQHADACALVDDDVPLGGLLVARDDLEERGLPGAVRADEPVPRAAHQLQRDVLEEAARAIGLAERVDRDHASATSEVTVSVASRVSPPTAM